MSTIWAFHHLENSLFHRQGCMKKFSESLREHAKNIIQIEKRNMLALRKKELKSHQDATECYIC